MMLRLFASVATIRQHGKVVQDGLATAYPSLINTRLAHVPLYVIEFLIVRLCSNGPTVGAEARATESSSDCSRWCCLIGMADAIDREE